MVSRNSARSQPHTRSLLVKLEAHAFRLKVSNPVNMSYPNLEASFEVQIQRVASERAKGRRGGLGKVGSGHSAQYYCHTLLARFGTGKGPKGKHKCWKQSLLGQSTCQELAATRVD